MPDTLTRVFIYRDNYICKGRIMNSLEFSREYNDIVAKPSGVPSYANASSDTHRPAIKLLDEYVVQELELEMEDLMHVYSTERHRKLGPSME